MATAEMVYDGKIRMVTSNTVQRLAQNNLLVKARKETSLVLEKCTDEGQKARFRQGLIVLNTPVTVSAV